MKLPPIQPARQQLISTTRLTLGYIYYELGYYREAIAHFRRIGGDREEYPQALLASSWAAIKLNDHQGAIITLNELIKKYEGTEYGEEAHFLLGECYLQLGFFDFATQQYDLIVQHYPENNSIAERIATVQAGLHAQEKAIENMKVNLLLLESKLIDMIPLQTDGKIPQYIEKERQRLQAARDRIFENIRTERDSFERFIDSINDMRRLMERMESRRHWRAYAEYGKTRAFFLKGQTSTKQ